MMRRDFKIGQRLSPVLEEIEQALWDFEYEVGTKPEYTLGGFRAASKIFMNTLLDKMYSLQEAENMNIEDKEKMATSEGKEVRDLIKTYTGIDTHELYK